MAAAAAEGFCDIERRLSALLALGVGAGGGAAVCNADCCCWCCVDDAGFAPELLLLLLLFFMEEAPSGVAFRDDTPSSDYE